MSALARTPVGGPVAKVAFLLARIVYPLSRGLSLLSMLATAAMMLVIAADVFMRRAFKAPIFGAYDIVKILLVVIVFCAVAYVMFSKEHVIVDSLSRLYPRLLKRVATGIAQFLSLVILAVISWQTVRFGLDMLRVGERLVLLKIPIAPFIFVVGFGYAIFFLVVLVQFIFTLTGGAEDAGQPTSPGGVTDGQH